MTDLGYDVTTLLGLNEADIPAATSYQSLISLATQNAWSKYCTTIRITTEIRDMMNRSTRYDLDDEKALSTAAEMLVDSVQPVVP